MTPSIDAHLLEEYSCQISSRSDLNRRSLRLFWRYRPNHKNKKNKNKINSNMIRSESRQTHRTRNNNYRLLFPYSISPRGRLLRGLMSDSGYVRTWSLLAWPMRYGQTRFVCGRDRCAFSICKADRRWRTKPIISWRSNELDYVYWLGWLIAVRSTTVCTDWLHTHVDLIPALHHSDVMSTDLL